MEVVSADSNGVVGIHPQQPELGATWQIHFKMACVFLPFFSPSLESFYLFPLFGDSFALYIYQLS